MVHMGMGKHQCIDAGGIKLKGFIPQPVDGIATLVHAAIEQNPADAGHGHQMAGSGDLLSGTEKLNRSHDLSLLMSVHSV